MWQVGLWEDRCPCGDLYGWGSGPITAPGSGTQSWLLCPLISMALARAEVLRSVVPFSVGGRAQVPVDQAQFWQHNVPHAIDALSNQFLAFPPNDPRAVALATRDSWGARGDPLPSQAAVQEDVMSMLTVWLTEQIAPQFSTTARNTDSPVHLDVVSQSPRTSPPPNPFNSVHQTTGRTSGGVVVSSPFAHLNGSFAENNSVTDVAVEVVQGAGPTRLTRFLEMSRDLFYSTLNSLIIAGRFNHIGHAHVRLEGQTAWGVWLRVDHWRGAHSSRPRLRCGVLYHVANRELTFHGSAATQLLLPIFADWTYPP